MSVLAAHTHHFALGTHHPSQQLMPDHYCQGKARAESGTCIWKFLNPTVSGKLNNTYPFEHSSEQGYQIQDGLSDCGPGDLDSGSGIILVFLDFPFSHIENQRLYQLI
jgi:hypothetical protein